MYIPHKNHMLTEFPIPYQFWVVESAFLTETWEPVLVKHDAIEHPPLKHGETDDYPPVIKRQLRESSVYRGFHGN